MLLRFAVVDQRGRLRGSFAQFCGWLTAGTGLEVQPLTLADHDELRMAVLAGEAELAWASPIVSLRLDDAGGIELVAALERHGATGYHSALFCLERSDVRTLADLAGKTVAWSSADSASGYVVPRWQLRVKGLDPDVLFGEQVFCGPHAAVVDAVLRGRVDVGATHCVVEPGTRRIIQAAWPRERADLRVLQLVGPIPPDMIVAAPSVPVEAVDRVRAALVAAPREDDAVRAVFQADGFAPATARALDSLRRLAGRKTAAW